MRVIITEDGTGTLDVKYQVTLEGSDKLIYMRPSHVAGQLFNAAVLIAKKRD
jgi:hypothetical protein